MSLNSFKNNICQDIMHLVNNQLDKITYPYNKIDKEEYLHFYPEMDEDDIAYEFYGYIWPKKIKNLSLHDDWPEFSFTVAIIEDKAQSNLSVSGGNITALGQPGIDVIIKLPSNFNNNNLKMLREEIGITVAHELEHLCQEGEFKSWGRNKNYYELNFLQPTRSKFAKYYLLRPQEVAAHVIGYATVAQSINELENKFNELFEVYIEEDIICEKEKNIVLAVWMDWAKRNLSSLRFK